MLQKCATCLLYIPKQKTCQLMPNIPGKIKPTDFCSQHKNFVYTCARCGRGTLDPVFEIDEQTQNIIVFSSNCEEIPINYERII